MITIIEFDLYSKEVEALLQYEIVIIISLYNASLQRSFNKH